MRAALAIFFLVFFCLAARAELVVVTSPTSGIERLSREELIHIYLGRYRLLPSGIPAEPLDLPASHEARARFYQQLVGKNLAEINAYWARLVFSGKTRPPRVVTDYPEALRAVREKPGVIAYVDEAQVDARLKIVFRFEE